MGRQAKTGLDYFPLDTDFFEDEKLQFVSARFGVKGESIVVRLLCRIYRQGYFIPFNDDMALLFARNVGDGSLHGLVNDVVHELLKRGFFHEGIFKKFSILTSIGIQKRYDKICRDARRAGCDIDPKHDLLQGKSGFTPEESGKTQGEITQSKVKDSKEKDFIASATPEQKEQWKGFQDFLKEHAPNVLKMKEPLRAYEYFQLVEKWGKIGATCKNMHNHKPLLAKNVSAYLTINNWKLRETEK